MTTVTELYANQSVARLVELNTLVVVFSSHADGSGDSIELQRALEIDEQNVELGARRAILPL